MDTKPTGYELLTPTVMLVKRDYASYENTEAILELGGGQCTKPKSEIQYKKIFKI